MRYKAIHSLFLIFTFLAAKADIFPKNESKLNHTNIYFEEEEISNAKEYVLEVYCDTSGKAEFLLASAKNSVPTFWVSNLIWDARYKWWVKALDGEGKIVNQTAGHTFSTLPLKIRNSMEYRVDVIANKNDQHAGGLIALDYLQGIIDRTGKTVWTLPEISNLITDKTQLRDLRITKDNTVTFISDSSIAELTLNGEVLWKVLYPYIYQGDTMEFHHDFRKTDWGTYLVLGNKVVLKPVAQNNPTELRSTLTQKITYKKTRVGVAMEFDKDGHVIWFWDSEKYLKEEDLNFKESSRMGSHMNALGVDKRNTLIFLGFRNLNRIIKIDKASGIVINSWGEKFPSKQVHHEVDFFHAQHDATLSSNNSILILDNGERESKKSSKVVEFKQDFGPNENPILWEFALDFDTLSDGKTSRGGNVTELPNGNRLICEGELNRIIEVTPDKKVVWDAFVTSRNHNSKRRTIEWRPLPQYRAHWIDALKEYHFWTSKASFKGKKNITFKITNTGNAKDHYNVTVTDLKGTKVYISETKPIPEGETINININTKDHNTESLKISITSANDNNIGKTISVNSKN